MTKVYESKNLQVNETFANTGMSHQSYNQHKVSSEEKLSQKID